MSPTYKLFFSRPGDPIYPSSSTWRPVQVGDFVSNELGMDLLGDALEPTKILGGTEFWGAGIEAEGRLVKFFQAYFRGSLQP